MKRLPIRLGIALLIILLSTSNSSAGDFQGQSPFNNNSYYHNGKFANNLIVNGIDISEWQHANSDLQKAKQAGADFVILRVTGTYTTKTKFKMFVDDNFPSHYKKAKANGMLVGVYVFSQATNTSEAIQEANHAIKRLKTLGINPKDLDLPVYMDYEFSGGILGRLHGISRNTSTNSAVAFCNTIKSAGYTPGIYANTSFFKSQLDTKQFASDVDLWCAQYHKKCESNVNYTKWQYSSSSKVNGILASTGLAGNVDTNFWYLSKNNTNNSHFKIIGNTIFEKPEDVNYDIYYDNTQLKANDYKLTLLKNTNKTYALILGKNKFAGYALIEINFGEVSEDIEPQKIECSNHLAYASKEMSHFIPVNVKVTATKVKSLKKYKKAFKVSVAKKSSIAGYEIRYSRNKNMSNATIKNIGKSTSKKINVKVRKKKFYVQVRTYKDVDGIRYYSGWSTKKSITTK